MSDVQLMQQILDQTKTMVKMRKEAKFSDLRGENPESMPGSCHDKPVSVPGADKEVKQRFPGEPAGARTMAGAGDNSAVTRGHALTAEESVLDPKKKPMIENETMNVELDKGGAADLGNDLLSTIKRYKEEKKAAQNYENAAPSETNKTVTTSAPPSTKDKGLPKGKKSNAIEEPLNAKVASEGEAKTDPTEGENVSSTDPKNADANEDKNVPSLPNKSDATPQAKKPAASLSTDGGIPKASGTGNYIELSQDILAKIAGVILSTQEGCDFAETLLAKTAGEEAAKETMSFINDQKEEAEKAAAYTQGQNDAEAFITQLLDKEIQMNYKQAYDKGSAETVAYLKKAGLLNQAEQTKKAAYNEGAQLAESLIIKAAQDIMAAQGGMPGGEEALAGLGGEAGGMPPGMDPAAGGMPEGDAMAGAEGGGGDITPEEVGQALAEMVANGELSEEEALQIIQAIQGETGTAGGEEALAGGGEAEEEGGEEGGEEEKEEKEEEGKEAASPIAQLLATLKKAAAAADLKKKAAKKPATKPVKK